MSLDSAAGSGSAVTPGWYSDPHDPSQLRWWSGEGWTEHVSPGAGQAQVVEQAAAAPVQVQQPVQVEQPVQAQEPVQPVQVEQPVQVQQPVQPFQSAQDAPLPSRRALRDPAVEATDASAAAEAALASQAAQQQAERQAAQEAQAAAQAQAAQQAAQPQYAAPVAAPLQSTPLQSTPLQSAQTPSTPIPTLPVAPTSFLEQQGYAPLDGAAPADANSWGQPQAAVPEAPQLPPVETAQPNAWNQPVEPVQPVQPAQPVQPEQIVEPAQPAQPVQPNAWNEPVQPQQPSQQGWGSPTAPTAAPTSDGIDNLFAGAPAATAADQTAQANQWGLTPNDAAGQPTRSTSEVAAVAGSSSFWAWLIAISPILAAGSVAYVLLSTKAALTSWPFEAAVAAPYLLVLLFALADRSALLNLGHTSPRSPAWALLTAPIYLIARAGETRREDGSGTLLTIVWFISFIVAIGGIVGYGFLTHHALIAGLPA